MGLFDDIPSAQPAAPAGAQATGLFDDIPGAPEAQPSAQPPARAQETAIERTPRPEGDVVPVPRSIWESIISHIGGSGKTGLLLSENAKGDVGPGILTKPIVAGTELMQHGYTPRPLQPVSSEDQMPDVQGIKLAAEAAPAAMSGTQFATATPQAVKRAVAAEEALTKQYGPGPTGIPQKLTDKYGSQNPREALIRAGEAEGVTVPRHIASESKIDDMVAGGLSSIPLMGEPIRKSAIDMAEQMGGRTAELAGNASTEAAVPGAAAKSGILDWTEKGFRQSMDDTYRPLDKFLRRDTLVPLNKTREAAGKLLSMDIESASPDGRKVISYVMEALQRPEGLTWRGLKELRTRVGERVNGDIAPDAGTSARALKQLYGAMTEDVRIGAGKAGRGVKGGGVKRAIAAFDTANEQANALFDLRRNMTEIVGREGDNSAESVFHRITAMASGTSRGDIEQLLRAKTSMGSAWDRVSESVIARMGLDEKTGRFSPDRFLTDYNKKLSDEGRGALFGDETRQHLDNIATLAQAWSDAAKKGNPSGTARGVAVTSAIAAAYTHPLLLLADVATGFTLAKILSSPAGARAADAYITEYTRTAANPANRAAYERAAKNLAEIANKMGGGSGDEPAAPKGDKQKSPERAALPARSLAPANAMGEPAEPDNAMSGDLRNPLREGATATNPVTGARVIRRGDKWVPLQ